MKKLIIGLGLTAAILGVVRFVHLVNNSWKHKSDEDLYAERQQALDNGHDRHSSLVKAYDQEIDRRSDERYEKENPIPKERVHREHGWYLPNDD